MERKYFKNIRSLAALKKLHKELAKKYHSDVPGGDDNIMAEINAEHDAVYEHISRNTMNRQMNRQSKKASALAKIKESQIMQDMKEEFNNNRDEIVDRATDLVSVLADTVIGAANKYFKRKK